MGQVSTVLWCRMGFIFPIDSCDEYFHPSCVFTDWKYISRVLRLKRIFQLQIIHGCCWWLGQPSWYPAQSQKFLPPPFPLSPWVLVLIWYCVYYVLGFGSRFCLAIFLHPTDRESWWRSRSSYSYRRMTHLRILHCVASIRAEWLRSPTIVHVLPAVYQSFFISLLIHAKSRHCLDL